MKNMTMEEKKSVIEVHMKLLKDLLVETELIIAFDKTNDNLLFLDKENYITNKTSKGFKIDFKSFSY